MTQQTQPGRVPCVGGVVVHRGALLLVQRGHEPSRGLWSIPGGRLLPGEDPAAGCRRELLEETGLHVVVGRLVGTVERDAPDGRVYVIDDLLCTLLDHDGDATGQKVAMPVPVAGDDADDAAWFTSAQVERMQAEGLMAAGVLDALREWHILDLLR